MFYDRTHPNYPFFHRSCKTSLAINLSAFPMHTLNEEKRKRKKRAMNMYDKCIPHSFLLLVWYRYLKMLFRSSLFRIRISCPDKTSLYFIHRLNHPCWTRSFIALHYGWPTKPSTTLSRFEKKVFCFSRNWNRNFEISLYDRHFALRS